MTHVDYCVPVTMIEGEQLGHTICKLYVFLCVRWMLDDLQLGRINHASQASPDISVRVSPPTWNGIVYCRNRQGTNWRNEIWT
jgi:hypothetical protein